MSLDAAVQALRKAGLTVRVWDEPESHGWQPPGACWVGLDVHGATLVGTYHSRGDAEGEGRARLERLRAVLEEGGFDVRWAEMEASLRVFEPVPTVTGPIQ